jgi:peptidoglycan hydrolase CwlO-like protein
MFYINTAIFIVVIATIVVGGYKVVKQMLIETFDGGRYVLYTDHLAALAEKHGLIMQQAGAILNQDKQIAALTAHIKELEEEWKASMCIPREVSVCDVMNKNHRYQKDIKEMQARIKELEENWIDSLIRYANGTKNHAF